MKEVIKVGLIGGPEQSDIVISEYNSEWPKQFEERAEQLRDALGDSALLIEHIGSTSVPGLAAKPIIDILIVVEEFANEVSYLPVILSSGYELRVREPDRNKHRMFRTFDRTVHVHVYSSGCIEIERYLLFRNRLRQNSADRERYEQFKTVLAKRSWSDTNQYANAKTTLIEEIITAARMEND